jgi:hypothetical protein
MSLDVSLIVDNPIPVNGTGVFVREEGKTRELSFQEVKERYPDSDIAVSERESNFVFKENITHNLGEMAEQAGLYTFLWRPEEAGITLAKELIEPLRQGLHLLKMEPERFKKFNPENGWGNYGGLVGFVESYLNACYEYPEAKIEVDR